MAVEVMTKAKRRFLHHMSGWINPSCLSKAVRELKRGHRRLTRRQARLQIRSATDHDS